MNLAEQQIAALKALGSVEEANIAAIKTMNAPSLNAAQLTALKALNEAHHRATNSGLFDAMLGWVSGPDSINDVCDAVSMLLVVTEVPDELI